MREELLEICGRICLALCSSSAVDLSLAKRPFDLDTFVGKDNFEHGSYVVNIYVA